MTAVPNGYGANDINMELGVELRENANEERHHNLRRNQVKIRHGINKLKGSRVFKALCMKFGWMRAQEPEPAR